MMKTVLFAAAAAITTVASAAPVLAKDVLVPYGDLDLASAQGQRTLSHRLHRAAQAACDFHAEPRIRSEAAIACYREARARAKTQVATIIEDARLGG